MFPIEIVAVAAAECGLCHRVTDPATWCPDPDGGYAVCGPCDADPNRPLTLPDDLPHTDPASPAYVGAAGGASHDADGAPYYRDGMGPGDPVRCAND